MGNPDNVFKVQDSTTTQLPDGVAIVASLAQIEQLSGDLTSPSLIRAVLLPRAPSEPIPEAFLDGLKVLVLEVDPALPQSLARLERIRHGRPSLAIIAAIAPTDHTDITVLRRLLHLGIRDVIRLPLSGQEITSQLLDILISTNEPGSAPNRGSLVLFQRAVGGAGATTVLTHAAQLMAQANPSTRICVVDLDVQTGAVAQYLGAEPLVDLGALLDANERMDAALVEAALLSCKHGFHVLAAPEAIRPLESLDVNHVLRLFEILRSRFDCVLVDLPAAWSNWSLSLATTADRVIIVCGTTIASLRQAKRKLHLLSEVGVDPKRVATVANKLERRLFKAIGAAEMEAALGCDVLASLGSEGNEITAAQDIGCLIHELNRRSKFLSELGKLVVPLSEMAGVR